MRTGTFLAASFTLLCLASTAHAADWPMHRCDAGRSGYTPGELPADLKPVWTLKPASPPDPAWPTEPRATFDHAPQPIVAGGKLFFGSSADGTVRALDAATGKEIWCFFTGAPVRVAPAAWKDRVFAASDDGFLYCLSAAEGKVIWKKRAGPRNDKVLGNGRIISRWPVRGGPAVVDGIVYFAAGVFPSEGTYLYALRAESGEEVWANKTAGRLVRPHPHAGGFKAGSGIGFQGHLAVAGERVFAPTGRSNSPGFSRTDGTFKFFPIRGGGGTSAATFDSFLLNNGYVFKAADGKNVRTRGFPVEAFAATPELVIYARSSLVAQSRAAPFSRAQQVKWTVGVGKAAGTALIVAGKKAICSGGSRLVAVDIDSRKVVWNGEADGTARCLAAAGGRLYVGTDKGVLHCFGAEGGGKVIGPEKIDNPYGAGGALADAAKEIVEQTGITEGYCLDLGCGDGRLAFELARRTKLRIIGVEADAAKVAEARRKLSAAGLYGSRVTILQGDPAGTGCPDHFANLVVSARSAAGGGSVPEKEALRYRRPWGGVLCVGKPGAMKVERRGELPGAGQWTHQYGSAAGLSSSEDELAAGPLGVLWFGGPDIVMPNRHGRPPAPLFYKGQLYVMGRDELWALDAYNGRPMWKYPFKGIGKIYDGEHLLGTAATGSTLCVAEEGVFVRYGEKCLRLDRLRGEKLGEFKAPEGGTWGFVACVDGVLFGSTANTKHQVPDYYHGKADMNGVWTESTSLFALEAGTGKLKWTFKPRASLRHNTIAIGGGRVYLIDRELAAERGRHKKLLEPHKPGELVALEIASGKQLWRKTEDIYGTVLALSEKHDVLLMSYQPPFRGKGLTSEVGGRMTAFKASGGGKMWDAQAAYTHRPVVIDRTVYLNRGKLDLLTGKLDAAWRLHRSYGCGPVVGSQKMLLFRSAVLGYIELGKAQGTRHFGGLRPGCWVTAIPAGGLVLAPDFTENCGCAYLNKTNVVLQTLKEE